MVAGVRTALVLGGGEHGPHEQEIFVKRRSFLLSTLAVVSAAAVNPTRVMAADAAAPEIPDNFYKVGDTLELVENVADRTGRRRAGYVVRKVWREYVHTGPVKLPNGEIAYGHYTARAELASPSGSVTVITRGI